MQASNILKGICRHPANADNKFAAIYRSLAWQVRKRSNKKALDVDFHGLRFLCFPQSRISSSVIYFNGLPDYREMQFIKQYLESGDNFIDIGANIGLYTLYAASLINETGRIDSFEAIPETALKLEKQIKHNSLCNVKLHTLAVSDNSGVINFYLTKDDCTAHLSFENNDSPGLHIESVRLDDYLDPKTEYAMGKMDIEGAEILALKGATGMLEKANPPVWQLELSGYSKRYGFRSDQVLDFLKQYDYHCAMYDTQLQKIRFTDEPWNLGITNILAINNRDRKFIRNIPIQDS